MKHLVNYCPIAYYEEKLQAPLQELISRSGLQGIEQFLYEPIPPQTRYKDLTVGIHLKYWPYWLDFYLRRKDSPYGNPELNPELKQFFWKADKPEQWLDLLKRHWQAALSYEPEYLVYHVSEANDREIFTYDFRYSSRDVLKYTAEIINFLSEVLPAHQLLLFENLWWPGLRLTSPREVDYFFSLLSHPKVGIMLDTGHLMNTNLHLRSQEAGIDYIIRTIDKLGSMKQLIKGIHLSSSLSGSYLLQRGNILPAAVTTEEVWGHVARIDQHQPFTTPYAAKIISSVQPAYLIHELSYDSPEHMLRLAREQKNCIDSKSPV